MKSFPKTIYVMKSDDDSIAEEYFVETDKSYLANEEAEDTQVAVYKLVKVGTVKKSSKLVFEKEE